MKAIGVIPARYDSERFEGKVLADLLGKPLIQHVWERAKESRLLSDLIIACDDERVLNKAKEFGAEAVLTSSQHQSGSDRIAEVIQNLEVDIVINIQGDEPLIDSGVIDLLCQSMINDKSCLMATVIKPIGQISEIEDPNIVKVVIDQNKYALYFSRSKIPYKRNKDIKREGRWYKHLGMYAYQKSFLLTFKDLPKSQLEQIEQLEQLRALDHGYKIKTVETEIDFKGVDTREDLQKVEEILRG